MGRDTELRRHAVRVTCSDRAEALKLQSAWAAVQAREAPAGASEDYWRDARDLSAASDRLSCTAVRLSRGEVPAALPVQALMLDSLCWAIQGDIGRVFATWRLVTPLGDVLLEQPR